MHAERTPAPFRSASRRRVLGKTRLVLIGVAVVVTGIGLTLAVPKFLGSKDTSAERPATQVAAPRVAPAEAPQPAPQPVAPARTAPQIPTSAEGDLVLEVKLRWQRVAAGSSLPATVRVGNASLQPFQVPAPGEPHPTLALVVLDAEGHEVRRVVEFGPDPYPRRTSLVAPGAAVDLQALVLSSDDAPLPPGEYTVYAEMKRDPAWARLGMPMWKAPKGSVRSLQEPVTIVARE